MSFVENIPVVFLAFGNEQDEHLPVIQEEQRAILSHLLPLEEHGVLRVYIQQSGRMEDIVEALNRFRQDIILFHFAGHAGSPSLQLEGRASNASELTAFLGDLPQLQLVFLNGSSTQSQVKTLLDAGVRAVLATQGSVQDRKAMDFAVSFYQSLTSNRTISQAFEYAKAAVETKYTDDLDIRIRNLPGGTRSLSKGDVFPWGLYVQEDQRGILNWRLPIDNLENAPDENPNPISELELSPFLFNNYHFVPSEPVNSLYQFSHYEESRQLIHYKSLEEGKSLSIGPKEAIYQPIWQSFQDFWEGLDAIDAEERPDIPGHPQKVHALLIGINKYPTPLTSLEAPEQDVLRMKDYLESQPLEAHVETLTGAATRQTIIDTLVKLMNKTSPGDAVLFYFSGLGQKEQSPNPSETIPAILCFDQERMTIDEIVYLLCRQKEKALHPIIILDTGVNEIRNKEVEAAGFRSKGISATGSRRPWEAYVFASALPSLEAVQTFMEEAAFVLVTACEYDQESAYEKGDSSLLTEYLIAALNRSNHRISYQKLNERLKEFIESQRYQHPEIIVEGEKTELRNQNFLGQPAPGFQPIYGRVVWNERLRQWTLDMGTLLGIQANTIIHLCNPDFSGNVLARVCQCFPNYAEVHFGEKEPDKEGHYFAYKEEGLAYKKVRFRFGPQQVIEPESLARQKEQLAYEFAGIEFTDKEQEEDFVIWLEENAISIAGTGQKDKHFFKAQTDEQVRWSVILRKAIKKISHWHSVKTLDDYRLTRDPFAEGDLKVEIFKVKEKGLEFVQEESGEIIIPFDDPKEGEEPSGRVRVKLSNSSKQKRYCSLLYLSMDFQVASGILGSSLMELEPGAAVEDIELTLYLEELIKRDNWYSAFFFIKVLDSDQPFDVSMLDQGTWDFPMAEEGQKRGIKTSTPLEALTVTAEPEWTCSLIKVRQPNPFYKAEIDNTTESMMEKEEIQYKSISSLAIYLDRQEQVDSFSKTLTEKKLPFQILITPAPPKSVPQHMLQRFKLGFQEQTAGNAFTFDQINLNADEGEEGIRNQFSKELLQWVKSPIPSDSEICLIPIYISGNWYEQRSKLLNWVVVEAEQLFNFKFKRTIIVLAIDVPEKPNPGIRQKVIRRKKTGEHLEWLENVAKSFESTQLLPTLGLLWWDDITTWLRRYEKELRPLFPEWPPEELLRQRLGDAEDGYHMEWILEVLENIFTKEAFSRPYEEVTDDKLLWEAALEYGNTNSFEEYLKSFPNGQYTQLALLALQRLRTIELHHEVSRLPEGTKASFKTDHELTHQIKVMVQADRESLASIEKVIYYLHRSFKKNIITIDTPQNNFALDLKVWGTFDIKADVHFKDGVIIKLDRYLDFTDPTN